MHGGNGAALPVDFWVAVVIVAVCVALSAFFAGAETALTAASKARMFGLEKSGDKRAATVTRLIGSRARLIGAMLLGNTLVNIGASALATTILTNAFGDAGVLYATVIMTIVLLIFAEVLPKTIGINFPDRMALVVARPAAFFVAAFTTRGPRVMSPYFAVSEMEKRMPAMPLSYMRSQMSFSSWRHSK